MSSRNAKRDLIVANAANKRARRDANASENGEQIFVPPNINLGNDIADGEIDFSALEVATMTAAQKVEVSEINALLKKCYDDAPSATYNPKIQDLMPMKWHKARYDPGNKSLAYILHMEEGWTVEQMREIIGKSPVPFMIYPLIMKESRWLWTSLRFSNRMENLRFKVDIPPNWLTDKMIAKEFSEKSAEPFTQKLAAIVAYNQEKFLGKGDYWFRPLCETLNFKTSENFMRYGYLITLFVVCVDASIFKSSTKNIKGTWGKSSNRGKVSKAFKEAVKEAIKKKRKLNYPHTLKLFQNLFPEVLK